MDATTGRLVSMTYSKVGGRRQAISKRVAATQKNWQMPTQNFLPENLLIVCEVETTPEQPKDEDL
jgi:hypothetical protein